MPCPNRITRASPPIPPYVGNCSARPSRRPVSTRNTAASSPAWPALEWASIFPRNMTSSLTCSKHSRRLERTTQFVIDERETAVLQSIGQNHDERAEPDDHHSERRDAKSHHHTAERRQATLGNIRRQERESSSNHNQKPRQRQQRRGPRNTLDAEKVYTSRFSSDLDRSLDRPSRSKPPSKETIVRTQPDEICLQEKPCDPMGQDQRTVVIKSAHERSAFKPWKVILQASDRTPIPHCIRRQPDEVKPVAHN